MRRSLMFALILSLGHASVAMAGRGPHDADFAFRGPRDADFASWGGSWGGKETLLQSGKRLARQVAESRPLSAPNAFDAKGLRTDRDLQPALQAQTGLAQSGLRKRTKTLIGVGIFAAVAGVMYAIDRGVEDNTPSSLGQR